MFSEINKTKILSGKIKEGSREKHVKLNLKISTKPKKIPMELLFVLPIRESIFRLSYGKTFCDTYVHEFFHHLGLVDEYEELKMVNGKRVQLYPQRKIYENSIMSSARSVFLKNDNQVVVTAYLQNGVEVSGRFSKSNFVAMDRIQRTEQIEAIKTKFFYKNRGFFSSNGLKREDIKIRREELSGSNQGVLREDQLNVFLYPNCRKKNENYYKDSDMAYSKAEPKR